MSQVTLRITGMDCAACAPRIDRALASLHGVRSERVNYASGYALLDYDEAELDLRAICTRVRKSGFGIPLEEAVFSCEGIGDGAIARVAERLRESPGVESASIDADADTLTARLYPVDVDTSRLIADCRSCGADLRLVDRIGGEKDLEDESRLRMLRTLVACALLTAPLCWSLSPTVQFALATLVQFGPGLTFYRGAARSLRGGGLGMDLLIALSTTIIYAYSAFVTFTVVGEVQIYFLSQCTLMTLLLFGRYFENLARSETSRAIRKLMRLQPDTATVVRDGDETVVDISDISESETVVVRTGDRIPVDGTVIEGSCTADESAFTGESMPVDKDLGDAVLGGTFCTSGSVRICAERLGSDSALQQVIEVVRRAQSSKAPIQRLADRIASWFVPIVMGIAATVFCLWYLAAAPGDAGQAMLCTCAVLIVACPCALGLATPTAIMVGSGRSAHFGVLFRGGEQLERAYRVDTVVFDKTGTITRGEPDIVDVLPSESCEGGARELLTVAASVERLSGHPLARVIAAGIAYRCPDALPPRVDGFEDVPGRGVRGIVDGRPILCGSRALLAEGGIDLSALANLPDVRDRAHTEVCVAAGTALLGVIGVADRIKPEARQAVERLHENGIRTILVTGDNDRIAQAIAHLVGIDRVMANVPPEVKAQVIDDLESQGAKVAMVGDGINDAPALAAADIAIAMGNGTDIAIDASDIVLMGGDVSRVPLALSLSRDTIRTIHQNLAWAAVYNAVCIPLAASGIMNPVIAAAAMCFSSVAVLANSLRLDHAERQEEEKDDGAND